MLAQTGLDLLSPQLVKHTIDTFFSPRLDYRAGMEGSLLLWSAAVIAASAGRGLFLFGQNYVAEFTAHQVIYTLRNLFYDHLQRLPFGYYDEAQTGQLMSRATADIDALRRFMGFGLPNLIRNIVVFTGVLILCLEMNWRLALLSLWTVPLLVAIVLRFGAKVRPTYAATQQAIAEMTAQLQENVTGVRTVKSFAQEERETGRFEERARGVLERSLATARVNTTYDPFMNFVLALGTTSILWYGGGSVIRGSLTLGGLLAFQVYLTKLVFQIRNLGWIVTTAQSAIASGQRIFDVLDEEAEVREATGAVPLTAVEGHVRFEDVAFGYRSGERVLKEIAIDAPPGSTTALLGATGSGKSTIIHLLPRFYDPTEGRITIDGRDLREITLESLRANVGLVLQESFLFSATLRENIAYGRPRASAEDVVEVARIANIHDFIVSLPDGYETQVGERGVTLSGGQKQRIAIARALLMNPKILVLDDSTSSVDTETEHLIQAALGALMENRTTFVIAQRLSTIQRADQILVLERGQIAARGTHAELIQRGGLYREIYNTQFAGQVTTDSPVAGAGPVAQHGWVDMSTTANGSAGESRPVTEGEVQAETTEEVPPGRRSTVRLTAPR
jgi:ABC-type multidrug transport system fused ATPase/permease subunit